MTRRCLRSNYFPAPSDLPGSRGTIGLMLITVIVGVFVVWLVLKILTGVMKDATKGVNALNGGLANLNAKMEAKLAEKMEQARRDGHIK